MKTSETAVQRFEQIACGWRNSHGVAQFLDANITLSRANAMVAIRDSLQLRLAALAVERLENADTAPQAKVGKLNEALNRDFGLQSKDGAKAWEDYLTLVGFEYLEHLPPAVGIEVVLEHLGPLVGPLGKSRSVHCWPYVHGEAVLDLLEPYGSEERQTERRNARWFAKEPDVLVECDNLLVFVENKAVHPTVPDHGEPTKLGELLVLGWELAQLAGKRFLLLCMTSADGEVRLRNVRGRLSLREAVDESLAALEVDEAVAPMIAASVQGFTWSDWVQALEATSTQLETMNDPFYAKVHRRRAELLRQCLDAGYRLGKPRTA